VLGIKLKAVERPITRSISMQGSDSLPEPLLQHTVTRNGRCGIKAVASLFLVIGLGFAVVLTAQENLAIQEPEVNLATMPSQWAGPAMRVVPVRSSGPMTPYQSSALPVSQPVIAGPFKQLWQPMRSVKQFVPHAEEEAAAEPAAEEPAAEDAAEAPAGPLVKGTMLRWNAARGFGFIKPEGGGEDIFCHITSLNGGEDSIFDGDPVTFRLEDDGDGKQRAEDVTFAGNASAAHVRVNGTMLRWNSEKGFGFIKPGAGGKDVFCHISALMRGEDSVKEGDECTFIIEEQRGQVRASRVRKMGDVPDPPQVRAARQAGGKGKGKGKGKRDGGAPRSDRDGPMFVDEKFEDVDLEDYMLEGKEDINSAANFGGYSPFAGLLAAIPESEREKTPSA